jgi:hypothetical protein
VETNDNVWETGARLEAVIAKLSEWYQEVVSSETNDPEQNAQRISLLNQIDTPMQLLKLCDDFEVTAGAFWDRIPHIVHPSYMPEIRIVDDGETDDPSGWRELALTSGHAVRMRGGEIVIGGSRTSPYTRPPEDNQTGEGVGGNRG